MIIIKIDVELRLADEVNTNVVAFGHCTIDRRIRFIVQVRKHDKDGVEEWKIHYPKLLQNDGWVNIIGFKDKSEIDTLITSELHKMLLVENLGGFVFDRIRILNPKLPNINGTNKVEVVADVELDCIDYMIKGIQLKQYGHSFLLQMPQYSGGSGFKDIVYPLNKDTRNIIRQAVFEAYRDTIKNSSDHKMIESEMNYLNKEASNVG